jgi:EAL domain-containing protein (putative c-di-GMP-specific phosphodiesterase class I)
MNVVAEGVETPGHFETVRRLGCDIMQGYGIGQPMPLEDFISWYLARTSQAARNTAG